LSTTPPNSSSNIRQVEKSDTTEIASFLSRAACLHKHLDWQGVLDWIPQIPFLGLWSNGRIRALLTCPVDSENVAWVRCFACEKYTDLQHSWQALFSAVCKVPELAGSTLYSVGLNDWFAQMLSSSGFENFQNIVVLLWNRRMPEVTDSSKQPWSIRTMESSDLDQVAELDRIAFETIWVNPPDKIRLAYLQSEHSSVVEMDGKIIGYEMTTANHFSAHLARIAVHPSVQKMHIGSSLLIEMFDYFRRKGIGQISVNTQSNNASSLALYKRMGFELTSDSFPVFRFHIP